MSLRIAALALAALLSACAAPPQGSALATRFVASPNVDARRPAFVIIHFTGDSSASNALRTLTSPSEAVSAHYLIARNGSITQLVDERQRAWHAGESRWGSVTDLNSASIGIELDNDGREPYPRSQIDALLNLLADLRTRHRLRAANVLGHADIAPTRKPDPGRLFPWRQLAASGFGLWCDEPYPDAPAGFDALVGLRLLGYDTRQPDAAITAFRLHFRPDGDPAAPLERDSALIACLVQTSLNR